MQRIMEIHAMVLTILFFRKINNRDYTIDSQKILGIPLLTYSIHILLLFHSTYTSTLTIENALQLLCRYSATVHRVRNIILCIIIFNDGTRVTT